MDLRIPRLSRQHLHVPVSATTDPTGFPVEVAILPVGTEPVLADFVTAEWDAGKARVLIGPGTNFDLDAGCYTVWVRVDGDAEDPVMRVSNTLVIHDT